MELDISLDKAIVPKTLHENGEEPILKLRLNEDGDTVTEKKRTSSKGGEFKQYTVYVTDELKEDAVINFCFGKHLRPLVKQYGNDTKNWAGNWFKVKTKKEGEHAEFEFVPVGMPESEEENVQ